MMDLGWLLGDKADPRSIQRKATMMKRHGRVKTTGESMAPVIAYPVDDALPHR